MASTFLLIPTPIQQRQASLYLILATVFWGCSFTWTKVIVHVINQSLGVGPHSPAGPVLLLGVRFTLAAVIWLILFPSARQGWTLRGIGRGAMLGALMAAGMMLQTTGLERTSVAVSSFLTSLTIIFVPLISILIHFKLPSSVLTCGVLFATAGIWLLTGATPGGLGAGEVMGLACAIVFSVHVLAINAIIPRDNAVRMTGIMLLTAGLLCLAAVPFMAGRFDPAVFVDFRVWPRLVLLVFVCTIGAFGLQMHFQPKIDPARAALLYLFEPIFAAVYAYVEIREKLTATQFLGGGADHRRQRAGRAARQVGQARGEAESVAALGPVSRSIGVWC